MSGHSMESPNRIFLKIIDPYPETHESVVTINPGESFTLGRAAENDIIVSNRYVSRNHIQIYWKGSRPIIRDLKSLNGTLINNVAIKEEQEIEPGDVLLLNEVKILVLGKLSPSDLEDTLTLQRSELSSSDHKSSRNNLIKNNISSKSSKLTPPGRKLSPSFLSSRKNETLLDSRKRAVMAANKQLSFLSPELRRGLILLCSLALIVCGGIASLLLW
jgi:pSer/pThr/pTyr-binding forkhead associated (FHA) protein